MSQTANSFLGIGGFLQAAQQANFGVVIVGGLLGGLLQPVVAKLNPRAEDPSAASFGLSPLLGVAAAGISVYVLANSDPDYPMRLLFFSLLCGLGFPAVLSSAVDNMSKRTTNMQQEMAQIASSAKSEGIEDTAKAAQQLKNVLSQNPPETVKPEGQGVIETAAEQVVTNIAQTPAGTATLERQVVEELKEVGTVAKTSGWDKTALAAGEQLRKLSETIVDKVAKAAAEQAADRLAE